MPTAPTFDAPQYLVRRKVFSLFGSKFHVYDPAGNVVLFANKKKFKLREDLRLYTDESMSTEVLSIKTPQLLDIGATYNVVDSTSGQHIGACRRKGLKSILRDEWGILDASGREVGKIVEDSTLKALLRRFGEIPLMQVIAPQAYHVEVMGQTVCTMSQNRNPFVQTLTVDFSGDPQRLLDRRVALAAAVLLGAIEGRQG